MAASIRLRRERGRRSVTADASMSFREDKCDRIASRASDADGNVGTWSRRFDSASVIASLM